MPGELFNSYKASGCLACREMRSWVGVARAADSAVASVLYNERFRDADHPKDQSSVIRIDCFRPLPQRKSSASN